MEDHPALNIRHMQIEDIEQVLQLDQLSFSMPWPRSSFRYEVTENKSSRHWVAEVAQNGQTKLVGMLVCWVIVDEVHIGTIAVHPDFRRQKIAEKMMVQAFKELIPEEVIKVFLEVRRSNDAARTLYRKLGFIEDGVRKRYYKDNQEDAILMQLPDLRTFFDKEQDHGSI
jgi:[ribosomal protein S18]-alanine N-acetyltransferase